MKKIVDILIFVLALLLMLLACSACRSAKTVSSTINTSDSVRLSVRDSTTNHFSFTFDSLVFSTTEFTVINSSLSKKECTDIDLSLSEKERLRAASVSSVCSVVGKNLPCSRLVVYGGRLSSNSIRSISQDSTSAKTIQETKTNKIRPSSSSLITNHLSLIILFALAILLFFLIRLRSSN